MTNLSFKRTILTMTNARFSDEQRLHVIQWAASQSKPWTIRDLAQEFGIHEQTAHYWKSALEREGLLHRHPIRSGKKIRYFLSEEASLTFKTPDTPVEIDPEAVRIVYGKERTTIAKLVVSWWGVNSSQYALAMLVYLFVRSYYAEAPDHQHLRGAIPASQVRSQFIELNQNLHKLVDTFDQLISFHGPWVEGPEFAERFGTLPTNFTLQQALEVAGQVNDMLLQQLSQSTNSQPPVGEE